MKDPLWKTILNWGAVLTFLSLPLVMLSVQLYSLTHPGWLTPLDGSYPKVQYLVEFQRNITILVFGLAGLRTWEHIKNGKNGQPPPQPLKNVHQPRDPQTLESKV